MEVVKRSEVESFSKGHFFLAFDQNEVTSIDYVVHEFEKIEKWKRENSWIITFQFTASDIQTEIQSQTKRSRD